MEELEKQIGDLKVEVMAKSDRIRELDGQIISLKQKNSDLMTTVAELKAKLSLAEDYFVIQTERIMEKL